MQTSEEKLNQTFQALAHPTRRWIMATLQNSEKPVGDLAKSLPISAPAVSRHLRILEQSGLVVRKIIGTQRIISLQSDGLAEAHAWVQQYQHFWDNSLDRLENYLQTKEEK